MSGKRVPSPEFIMASAPTDESRKPEAGFLRRQFDGVLYMWRTRETRHLLKLIAGLLGFMVASFAILVLLEVGFGDLPILVRSTFYVEMYSVVFFLFILLELVQLYMSDSKYKSFPEKNPQLRMKGWPSKTSRRYLTKIFGIFLAACVTVLVVLREAFHRARYFLVSLINLEFTVGVLYLGLLCFLLFLTAFVTVKGSVESTRTRYAERIHHKRFWFFALLPVPWVVFAVLLVTGQVAVGLTVIFGVVADFWYIAAFVVFGFLCLVSLFAGFNERTRVSFTISQIAATLTFLIVIIIPGIIGAVIGSLGSVVSVGAMAFFYFRGTLDENGHGLKKYYEAWDNRLKQFNITKEEDVLNKTYDKGFDETGLPAEVQNAYHDLLLALLLLVLTYFGFVFSIAPEFAVLGITAGLEQIDLYLQVDSWFEIIGLSLGVVVFTVISVFRRPKEAKNT